MNQDQLENSLREILKHYQISFNNKTYEKENDDLDPLMDLFGMTPDIKRENRQYWGRELGMCWQRLVIEVFKSYCPDFSPALKWGADEPCDCIVGIDAIDTKYRIGSGDSGTLKKFKQYGQLLGEQGLNPVLLIVREDNLPAALAACSAGGWTVLQGATSFDYIYNKSKFDLLTTLSKLAQTKEFNITR